eukprot:2708427-Prymnesium_polylepis.1
MPRRRPARRPGPARTRLSTQRELDTETYGLPDDRSPRTRAQRVECADETPSATGKEFKTKSSQFVERPVARDHEC